MNSNVKKQLTRTNEQLDLNFFSLSIILLIKFMNSFPSCSMNHEDGQLFQNYFITHSNQSGAAYQFADTVLCVFSPFWPSIVVRACNNFVYILHLHFFKIVHFYVFNDNLIMLRCIDDHFSSN